jgi:hypothetical protein
MRTALAAALRVVLVGGLLGGLVALWSGCEFMGGVACWAACEYVCQETGSYDCGCDEILDDTFAQLNSDHGSRSGSSGGSGGDDQASSGDDGGDQGDSGGSQGSGGDDTSVGDDDDGASTAGARAG